MEPVTWFLTGMEKHSEEFRGDMLCNAMSFEGAMRYHMSRFTYQSLHVAMNELSNHDHSRFLTRTNMKAGRLHTLGAKEADSGINKNIMFEAVTIQMTWPGAPTIYYGDEAGLTGWTDPDNRRTYPWGLEDETMLKFHTDMIKLHKAYGALKTGSVQFLHLDYGILSYARWDAKDTIIVILNNNDTQKTVPVPVWKTGVINGGFKRLVSTGEGSYTTDALSLDAKDGILTTELPAYSSMVLRYLLPMK
jgi:alpha-glucosidase